MEANNILSCILICFLLHRFKVAECQLTLAEAVAKLPSSRAGISAIYDGFDSIYLMGGYDGGGFALTDVLEYSLSKDEIRLVSSLPQGLHDGCGFLAPNGALLYAGGFESDAIYGARNEEGPWAQLSSLDIVTSYQGCVKDGTWSATMFGGWDSTRNIIELDLNTGTSSVSLDRLVEDCKLGSAGLNPSTQNATLFCTVASYMDGVILAYHKPSGLTSRIGQIPRSFYLSSVSFDGANAYVIGGWNSESLPFWGNEILMINTLTQEERFVSVEGIPSVNDTLFDLAASIYIPHLNRIYIFGGRRDLFEYFDTIWYIDLSPVNPIDQLDPPDFELFNCGNKSPGLYPHPLDCSRFIMCMDDGDIFVQSCFSPLLFDPELKTCNDADAFECGLGCEGRPDGSYPHPHNCALYIGCAGDEMTVYKCPPPTLYNPILRVCDYPEFVSCNITLAR